MKYRVVFLVFSMMTSFLMAECDQAREAVYEVPIHVLKSCRPPTNAVWVRGVIVSQMSDDTYLLQDGSGQITLFLQTDELIALNLRLQTDVLVFGRVDVSNVSPSKNELYAERIVLLPNREKNKNPSF